MTLAFEGALAHHDSAGNAGVIGPGDVQWMTAAAGILHKEYHEPEFARAGGPMHMMQLWVNLPQAHEMSAPRALTAHQMGRADLLDGAGQVRVIAGAYRDAHGPAKTFTPINLFDVRVNAAGEARFTFAAHENTLLLVMQGELKVGGQAAKALDLVLFENEGEEIVIRAKQATHLLLLNGEPINEPMVQYGPFVMNTQAEINQAIRDFKSGKFGELAD